MTRWLWPTLGGLATALLIWAVLSGSCARSADKPGQRADSVLATDSTYLRRIHEQDSAIAKLEDSIRVTDRDRRRAWDSARTLTRQADSSQAAIDAAVAAGIPPGTEPAVFWETQFRAQARVAAKLRMQVIPALERTIALDTVGIRQRDREIADVKGQRDFARARAREVTAEFRRYREDSRPGLDLGFVRVPEWAVDLGKVAAGVVIDQVVFSDQMVPRQPDGVVSDLELSP